MFTDITSIIQGVFQILRPSVVSLRPRGDITFKGFMLSLHPEILVSDDVDMRFTLAEPAARAGRNSTSVASMAGLPGSIKHETFLATARHFERAPVAYLVAV